MPAADSRRRRWIAFDIDFYQGDGRLLIDKWGPYGPIVWTAFLAACKKSSREGTTQYRSDNELTVTLGLEGVDIPFDLHDFFRWTGQKHWTTCTRLRNGPTTIEARAWDRWQTTAYRNNNGSGFRRSTAKKAADTSQKRRRGTAEKSQRSRTYRTGQSPVPPGQDSMGARRSPNGDATPTQPATEQEQPWRTRDPEPPLTPERKAELLARIPPRRRPA